MSSVPLSPSDVHHTTHPGHSKQAVLALSPQPLERRLLLLLLRRGLLELLGRLVPAGGEALHQPLRQRPHLLFPLLQLTVAAGPALSLSDNIELMFGVSMAGKTATLKFNVCWQMAKVDQKRNCCD